MSKGWLQGDCRDAGARRREISIVGLVDLDLRAAESRAAEFGLDGAVIGTDLDAVLDRNQARSAVRRRDSRGAARRRRDGLCATAATCSPKSRWRPRWTRRASWSSSPRRPARSTPSSRTAASSKASAASARRIDSGALGDAHRAPLRLLRRRAFRRLPRSRCRTCCCSTWRSTRSTPRASWPATMPLAVYCLETNPQRLLVRARRRRQRDLRILRRRRLHLSRLVGAPRARNTSWESAWRIIGTKGTLLWDGADDFEAKQSPATAASSGRSRMRRCLPPPHPDADARPCQRHRRISRRHRDRPRAGDRRQRQHQEPRDGVRRHRERPTRNASRSQPRTCNCDQPRQIHPHRHHDQGHRGQGRREHRGRSPTSASRASSRSSGRPPTARTSPNSASAALDAIGNRDITISTLGMFGNPLEDQRDGPPDAAGLEGLHRQRPPFRRHLRRRLHRPHPQQAADRQPAALQGGLERARQARRRQGRQDRLRELRHGRQLGDRRLEHRAQSRRLGADLQRDAGRQYRARMGALPPAGLSDRSAAADPQMGAQILPRARQGRDGPLGGDQASTASSARRSSSSCARPASATATGPTSSPSCGSPAGPARSTSRAGTTRSIATRSK